MPDIESRADIDALMVRFYGQALKDDVIGFYFTEIAKIDLEEHLPVIGDFWEAIILGTEKYRRHGRSPMMLHLHMHRKSPMLPIHFERWLELFRSSVDELFEGPNASGVKFRAQAIANRFMSAMNAT